MKRYKSIFLLLFIVHLLGCASLFPQQIPLSFKRPKPCQEFFNRLEEKVYESGARDASNVPIPGFPYLRTNRFLTALKENLKDDKAREAWVRSMQQLDLVSRRKEISNLPDEMILSMVSKESEKVDRERLISRVESCSAELLNHDQGRSDFYEALYPLVHVPDEYSCLMRTIGLYPLIALPVAVATQSSRNKMRLWFNENLEDIAIDGDLRAYVSAENISFDEKEIEEIVEKSRRNPLRVPLLDEKQVKELIRSFAPIFIQDEAAPYDRLGRVVWRGNRVEIDPEKPTVYYYISHAFLKGEPIFQINYVIWYSERAGKRAPWIERGHLDGLTARVSLDAKGKPFMVDVVMDCGCYHLFVPRKERVVQVVPRPFMFDPFVPQWLPTLSLGKSLGIRISSGWHQVQRLMDVEEPPNAIPYKLVPYDILEALPHENGRSESIFDAKGMVKATQRMERFILFSMGIPSVGSMRQKGHHAIELIGRVYFDDPNLFDQNFIFQ